MFCPECGFKLEEVSRFCESCGYEFSAEDIEMLEDELNGGGLTKIVIDDDIEEKDDADIEAEEVIKGIADEVVAEEKKDAEDVVIVNPVNEEATDEGDFDDVDIELEDDDLSYYLERIKDLETKNKSLRSKCVKLQASIDSLANSEEEIAQLKGDNESLKKQIEDLESQLKDKDEKAADIKESIQIILNNM